MTLDELIQQCATDIDEDITKSNSVYVGANLVLANKLISGINYAYHKLAREKDLIFKEETVTLDADRKFIYSVLTSTPIKVLSITDSYNNPVDWRLLKRDTVYCLERSEGESLTVRYTYLPNKLVITNLSDTPLIPEEKVDHAILCHYADFYALSLEPDTISQDKAYVFLGLFNNEIDAIIPDFTPSYQIRLEQWR